MELDNIKGIWQQLGNQNAELYNPSQIQELLRGKSNSVIATIRQNLLYEMGLTIVCMLFFLIMPFLFEGSFLQIIMGIWGLLCVLYLVFYRQKYILVNQATFSNENLKAGLTTLIAQLEKYTQYYFWGNVILIPLVHITNFILLFFFFKHVDSDPRIFSIVSNPVFIASYVVVASALMILFFRWYVNRMYGQYIQQLQSYLTELSVE